MQRTEMSQQGTSTGNAQKQASKVQVQAMHRNKPARYKYRQCTEMSWHGINTDNAQK